jgi:hypothetical protein
MTSFPIIPLYWLSSEQSNQSTHTCQLRPVVVERGEVDEETPALDTQTNKEWITFEGEADLLSGPERDKSSESQDSLMTSRNETPSSSPGLLPAPLKAKETQVETQAEETEVSDDVASRKASKFFYMQTKNISLADISIALVTNGMKLFLQLETSLEDDDTSSKFGLPGIMPRPSSFKMPSIALPPFPPLSSAPQPEPSSFSPHFSPDDLEPDLSLIALVTPSSPSNVPRYIGSMLLAVSPAEDVPPQENIPVSPTPALYPSPSNELKKQTQAETNADESEIPDSEILPHANEALKLLIALRAPSSKL